MAKQKRHLSKNQEFDIMKLVLDKFLLLGVLIMVFGLVLIVGTTQNFFMGFAVLVTGVILMIIFAMILVKEYHFLQN